MRRQKGKKGPRKPSSQCGLSPMEATVAFRAEHPPSTEPGKPKAPKPPLPKVLINDSDARCPGCKRFVFITRPGKTDCPYYCGAKFEAEFKTRSRA